MSITCPCCKAVNESEQCRRCKADLGLLAQYERQQEALRHQAVRSLLNRDFAAAYRAYRHLKTG